MKPYVAIVDYGLGNLYSVKHACRQVNLESVITCDRRTIEGSAAAILPGVGAFGDAMRNLQRADLTGVLRDYAFSGKPMMGICLGFQLLMEQSEEFGSHKGLGVLKGEVVRIQGASENGRTLKVPQVGWNKIHAPQNAAEGTQGSWKETPLDGLSEGTYMYFVHSYRVEPSDNSVVCCETTYGGVRFCSAIRSNGLFACQFHPERSGDDGLKMYDNFRKATLNGSGESG